MPEHRTIAKYTLANGHLNDLNEAEMRAMALELRRDRVSPGKIGALLGVQAVTIQGWIKEAIQDCIKAEKLSTQEIVRLELEELDYLQATLANDIDAGETGAVLAALKISESRRKLLGLDQPDAFKGEVAIREYVGVDPETDV